ncbi:endonuclease/exonuclease/phosphatase family protein [Humisphaera borealis]|uniref:Endonuclease/exonuclease/phosphatase family protein n=1 Tax=Humisphaera borealis TaxID=2807512 RepID=A0A7M2X2W8_9BACT|nr:endonuclease/exonuclease/phosphatase family protein [Humisphaera borealis]QOV92014.1 endonuclease/exonuclease/phosphatase family protein [Humisphaera borealis]
MLILVLLFVISDGWQRRSTGGETGTGLQGDAPAVASRRFRVGVFNIQGGVGKSDDAINRIGQALLATDVAGLVEVRANAWSFGGRDQARQIAESLQRGWIFAPAERRFWAPAGGNGLVSRFPVGRWTRLPLPEAFDPGSQRNILLVDLPIGDRAVRVMVTHVDRGDAHDRQLHAVTQLFESVAGPAVLLGDLNAGPSDPLVQSLLRTGAEDVIGRATAGSKGRVDWIITKGLKTVTSGHSSDPALSDHHFFWADLELLP